jgi:hypothetical protein
MTTPQRERTSTVTTMDDFIAWHQARTGSDYGASFYPTSPNGHVYGYSTERADGYYVALDYKPVGRGARSEPHNWQLTRTVKRRKRKDAKAMAWRWYKKASGATGNMVAGYVEPTVS